MSKKMRRCNKCAGCTSDWCGVCPFCLDNPRFGGPNIKRQTCVQRRCLALLQMKIGDQRRYRQACGKCVTCLEKLEPDCGVCLVCMDKSRFGKKFFPGALCHQKKCDNFTYVDFSRKRSKEIDSEKFYDNTLNISPKFKRKIENNGDQKSSYKKNRKSSKNAAEESISDSKIGTCENYDLLKNSIYSKKVKLKSFKEIDPSVLMKKLPPTVSGQNSPFSCKALNDLPENTSHFASEDDKAKSAEHLLRHDAFLRSVCKPRTAIERAFWTVLNIEENPISELSQQSEFDEFVKNCVCKTLAREQQTSPELIKLFNSLPTADFSTSNGSNFLPQFPTKAGRFIEPLKIESVRVKSDLTCQSGTENVGQPLTFLGYVISLDKSKLAAFLSAENCSATGDFLDSAKPLQAADKHVALQMKLLQMHSTQQLHNYAMKT